MKKIKITKYKGKTEKLTSDITIVRSLPNPNFNAIGSIVFLDHIVEKTYAPKKAEMSDGSFAHPHRGIATFSYLLEGGVHHLDSNGGEGKVYSGGIQWMNSGNGIIHDEFLPYDFQEKGGKFHGLQFWLNLPAVNKAKKPDYMAVQGKDVAEKKLTNDSGIIRILLGDYEGEKSVIPNFLDQFMYHLKLKPNKTFTLPTNNDWQYGIYNLNGALLIDDSIEINQKEIVEVTNFENQIRFSNNGNNAIDIMLFGGEPYSEKMVSYGPFIMNNQNEIAQAYSDYQSGKYGKIDYSTVKL